jgi:hypothetical protein
MTQDDLFPTAFLAGMLAGALIELIVVLFVLALVG